MSGLGLVAPRRRPRSTRPRAREHRASRGRRRRSSADAEEPSTTWWPRSLSNSRNARAPGSGATFAISSWYSAASVSDAASPCSRAHSSPASAGTSWSPPIPIARWVRQAGTTRPWRANARCRHVSDVGSCCRPGSRRRRAPPASSRQRYPTPSAPSRTACDRCAWASTPAHRCESHGATGAASRWMALRLDPESRREGALPSRRYRDRRRSRARPFPVHRGLRFLHVGAVSGLTPTPVGASGCSPDAGAWVAARHVRAAAAPYRSAS